MRCVVTGAAGFIGSHLVRYLLREGADRVVSVDGLTYAGHLENLAEVAEDPRHVFVHADICDAAAVGPHLSGADVVYHLAAETHVDRSIVADAAFVRTNVVGTANLLAAARAADVGRFVQVSTDEVYGSLLWRDPGRPPESGTVDRFTEESPIRPRSPYAATKAAADHIALSYAVTHGSDVVVTRGSNTYGPRQFPEKLIPVLVENALADSPLPLYGDGLHVRDWIHVEDHCVGLVAAAERGRSGRVYNLGGDSERTNLSVARAVLAALDKPDSLVTHVPDRPGHDRRYAIDLARSREELGWSPTADFETGLRATIDWYREHAAWTRTVKDAARSRERR